MTLEEINALEGEALDREVAVTVLGLVPGPRVGTNPELDAPEARLWYDPTNGEFLAETPPPCSTDAEWAKRVSDASGVTQVGRSRVEVCRAALKLTLGVTV
jgi:hypothetical protein